MFGSSVEIKETLPTSVRNIFLVYIILYIRVVGTFEPVNLPPKYGHGAHSSTI
jgi:hypothetical protein